MLGLDSAVSVPKPNLQAGDVVAPEPRILISDLSDDVDCVGLLTAGRTTRPLGCTRAACLGLRA